MTTQPKTPRTTKTPQQRAQEALDVEERRVERLTAKRDAITTRRTDAMQKAKADLEQIEPELEAANERRDWCAKSPDLPRRGDDHLTTTPKDDA